MKFLFRRQIQPCRSYDQDSVKMSVRQN